jgi:Protein of unknown function (DUF2934)
VTEEEIEALIRRRAHEMWEREGRPEGFALRHWLDAERRVREEIAYAAALRATPATGTGGAAALSGTGRLRAGRNGAFENQLSRLSDTV